MESLADVAGDLMEDARQEVRPTEFGPARAFVDHTGVDALAVHVGQIHLHGRSPVRLDFDRIKRLAELPVPLVLHSATSLWPDDLARTAELGVAKVNVGSRLKQAYFEALRRATVEAGDHPHNPYEIIGSGLADDVLMSGRLAMQGEVERFMHSLWGQRESAAVRHPIVIPDLGATGGDVRIVSWAVKEGQTARKVRRSLLSRPTRPSPKFRLFAPARWCRFPPPAGRAVLRARWSLTWQMKPKPPAADRLLRLRPLGRPTLDCARKRPPPTRLVQRWSGSLRLSRR